MPNISRTRRSLFPGVSRPTSKIVAEPNNLYDAGRAHAGLIDFYLSLLQPANRLTPEGALFIHNEYTVQGLG